MRHREKQREIERDGQRQRETWTNRQTDSRDRERQRQILVRSTIAHLQLVCEPWAWERIIKLASDSLLM